MGAFTPVKILIHLLFLAFICYGGWLTYSYRSDFGGPASDASAAKLSASAQAADGTFSHVSNSDEERMKRIVENAFEESMDPAVSYEHRRELNNATDEDYSDFGEPTMLAE